jgi:phosphohistidine phosphatase
VRKKREIPIKQTPSGPAKRHPRYELYIVRHGKAMARGEGGITDDAKRPLVPEGKKELQKIARGLVRLGIKVDWIVSSPLLRAVETAETLVPLLGLDLPMEVTDSLSPGTSPDALLGFLAKHPNRRRTLVVGHEPGLTELAARLIGTGAAPSLGFKKGGCCLIEFEEFPPRQGKLVWWATPRILRKLS